MNLLALGFNGIFPEVNDYVLQEPALESGFQSRLLNQGKAHFSMVWFILWLSEITRLLRFVWCQQMILNKKWKLIFQTLSCCKEKNSGI